MPALRETATRTEINDPPDRVLWIEAPPGWC
uniref:Uncharacterized protein n=1 Tax=Erwinia amylovora ATCC BAA-2158 TaxID=889211 RepID=E5B1T0_ERWAM|nr:hypothetical protein predicted by Glimmer/Critica [Erwinia amylovora ATCC BAA-2158]